MVDEGSSWERVRQENTRGAALSFDGRVLSKGGRGMNKTVVSSFGVFLALWVSEAVGPGMRTGICGHDPGGQRIVKKRHPDIQAIEEALAAVKKNRDAVLLVSRMVSSRSNKSLAVSFPDVCKSPSTSSPGPVPVPYPNTATAKDTTAGSKTVKLAGRAVALREASDFKKSEGDEAGTAVKRLEVKVGGILSERPLTREEERLFRKEWTDLVEKTRGLLEDLDQDIAEIEKILKEAKKELGIKDPL